VALIPKLANVSWITVEVETAAGFRLHGFLLYTMSDHFFPEYITVDGLVDLEVWSGDKFAIFIVHSPSEKWIEYARTKKHVWWKAFSSHFEGKPEMLELLQKYGSVPLLQAGDVKKTMREVFAPPINEYLHGDEIARILSYFELEPTQHPCLVLFKNLNDTSFWYVGMGDMVNMPLQDLRTSLKSWFAGSDFKGLLKEAEDA